MKYEFHIGDYVETITGEIGYIIAIENLLIGLSIRIQLPTRIQEFIVTEVVIPTCFNRVGQYDFTKKDKDKIEPLPENYTKPYIMPRISLEEYRIIDIGDISKKVNELVEAVNELNNKID